MDENKPVHRSFLRFGIRDLLWAMLIMGLALGWWVEQRRAAQLSHDLRKLRIAIVNWAGFMPGPIVEEMKSR